MNNETDPKNGIPKELEKRIWAWLQVIAGLAIFGISVSAFLMDERNRYQQNALYFGLAALYFVWSGLRTIFTTKKERPEPADRGNG